MSLGPAAMVTALVPATRIDPRVALQLSVIDLVMVMAPKPPGSRQSISPAGAVFEIAPAKVLQGAGAAARIGVVADAGDPGSGCLGVGRRRCQYWDEKSDG